MHSCCTGKHVKHAMRAAAGSDSCALAAPALLQYTRAACSNAWRGNKRLYVSSTAKLGMNSWLRLVLDNVNNVLLADLHSYLIPPDPAFNNRTDIVSVSLKVTEVRGSGVQSCAQLGVPAALHSKHLQCVPAPLCLHLPAPLCISDSLLHSRSVSNCCGLPVAQQIGPDYVGFDRPLPVNVSTLYRPELHSWASYTRTECGVEQLTIQMPWSPYAGMNKEAGWNALNFWWTPNSWVSDVAIFNAGVAGCSRACTIVRGVHPTLMRPCM